MIEVSKFVKNITANPKKALREIIPGLEKLKYEIERALVKQPLDGIVYFFNTVSLWHDRGIRDMIETFRAANAGGQYDIVIQRLEILELHFKNAGRDNCGWNRTKPGETVTEDNVYLGDIYGLFTKTVRFWKTCKDEPKDEWDGTVWAKHLKGKNSYDVVSRQAQKFMESHADPMTEIIGYLRAVAAA